jgi:hypothetical protein
LIHEKPPRSVERGGFLPWNDVAGEGRAFGEADSNFDFSVG